MAAIDADRYAGVLLGLAAGDALGAAYEFGTPPSGEVEMRGGGLGGWEPGEWTDDTQMAICIAEETASGAVDVGKVGGRFLEWYRSRPADVGIQTRAVLSGAASGAELAERAAEYFRLHPDGSAGNGSLMRTAPIALAALGDDEKIVELAMAVSALTHADPVAGEACALWCIAIDRAIRTGTLEGIEDGVALLGEDRQGYWRERLDEVRRGTPSDFSRNGYVVSALQAALAAIWHTPVPEPFQQECRHLQHALQTAVHIGGDTDTVAAIAGALLGAAWGASAVPVRWRAMLHGKPGRYGAPDYTAQDLVRLAVLSARTGKPDRVGWPAADDLLGYYDREWIVEPLVVPLAEDPGVLLANLYGALETPADVTISLCRMGRTQLDPTTHPIRVELGLLDSENREDNRNAAFVFADVGRAIAEWRDEGKTVLIHCVRGEHRTPAVAAAYVAARGERSGVEALFDVCDQLPYAEPNLAFEMALAVAFGGSELPPDWQEIMDDPDYMPPGVFPPTSPSIPLSDASRIWQVLYGEGADVEELGQEGWEGTLTFAEFDERLCPTLEAMLDGRGRWVLVVEGTPTRYVQFLTEERVIVAECVSNEFLEGDDRLAEDAEELLPELGWDWPAPPNQPNWLTVQDDDNAALDISVLALQTMRRVFECTDESVVSARLYRSKLVRRPATRGDP